MLTIAKLFGKSPFAPLQSHMDKVRECILLLNDLFYAVKKESFEVVVDIAKKISKKEHEADLIKNDIRNHLPKSIFLPIERSTFLDILSLQDSFADKAEDIAVILSLENLKDSEKFLELEEFYTKTIATFELAYKVIKEFDILIESSFGGIEAQKVKKMTENISYKEHELDLLGHKLLKTLFSYKNEFSYSTFFLWNTVLKELGQISNISENLGDKIRTLLEIK